MTGKGADGAGRSVHGRRESRGGRGPGSLARRSTDAEVIAVMFELTSHGVALDHQAGASSGCSPPQETSCDFNDEKDRFQANTVVAKAISVSAVEPSGICWTKTRGRLEFFNTEDGTTIHLGLQAHPHTRLEKKKRCIMCGILQAYEASGRWQGHFTQLSCGTCRAVCKIHAPFPKSCWDTFHERENLVPRAAPVTHRRSTDRPTS